jgi:hypothetical protein
MKAVAVSDHLHPTLSLSLAPSPLFLLAAEYFAADSEPSRSHVAAQPCQLFAPFFDISTRSESGAVYLPLRLDRKRRNDSSLLPWPRWAWSARPSSLACSRQPPPPPPLESRYKILFINGLHTTAWFLLFSSCKLCLWEYWSILVYIS